MRILHLPTSGDLGGAETSLIPLLVSLRDAEPRWEVSVIVPAPGRLAERLAAEGIPALVVPFPAALARLGESGAPGHRPDGSKGSAGRLALGAAAASSAGYLVRLARIFRRERPNIIHAHGFKTQILSAIAGPRRSALIWHVHGYVSGRTWTARALKFVRSRPRAVVANSRSVADDVRAVVGPGTLVRTIYNGLDLDTFTPDGPPLDLDRLCGVPAAPPSTVRVGLVGTFARWKGHHVFLDAVARLPAIVPLRAYVVGEPIYATRDSQFTLDQLRQAARERGLADRVAFSGFVDDVAGALRALDIVVHASTEPEPFGMVIAEAMACGRPVIASRAGGAVELFEEGVDAFGHSPGDAGELAAAIQMLAGDPVRRARAGSAARRTAQARFDRRRLASQLVPLYRTLATA